jgi:meso-butanediol dehydrogenase/(S,S)-butanediol dehydrogenase/diacetyl reductase
MTSAARSLADRVALVTGATSGIGAACARELSRRGARVMLTGRSQDRGAKLCAAIDGTGGVASFTAGDVRDRSFCDRAVEETIQRFGALDVLVNSAGVYFPGSGPDTTDAQWDETIATNASAVFFLSRAALRQMVRQQRGAIVNIASDWGLVGGAEAAAYCASKGAVILLTKAMALDHAKDGVRINAVCPTDTDTPMMHDEFRHRGVSFEEGARASGAAIPMGRMATADEVAEAVCFLASDAASFITGTALPIDGGATAV